MIFLVERFGHSLPCWNYSEGDSCQFVLCSDFLESINIEIVIDEINII